MVHALEEVHRLLKPDGCLIEIHPILENPLVKVFAGSTVLFTGFYPGFDYLEDLRQAEKALLQSVQRGLFILQRSREFDFLTYGSSITELQDVWEEPAESREAELYTQVEEVMQAVGQGVKVAFYEKARINKFLPMQSRLG
jgi:hypothetical protein